MPVHWVHRFTIRHADAAGMGLAFFWLAQYPELLNDVLLGMFNSLKD